MTLKRAGILFVAGILVFWFTLSSHCGQQKKNHPINDQLIGRWEIVETKEPGKPYRQGYKGNPFVQSGPNAFSLEFEYRKDGTMKRISRKGRQKVVDEGSWTMSGKELRHKFKGSPVEEVIYIRFDSPDEYTFIDVYEDTPDPGLFARFRRIPTK